MSDYIAEWKPVLEPIRDRPDAVVSLTDETIRERLEKVCGRMREQGLDQLIIYGDVEHGSNFEYLVGFFTRFEEALLLLNADGSATLALGNENLNKACKSRIPAKAVHIPLFSLPNQPGRDDKDLQELLRDAGVRPGARVGLVGWKLFTSAFAQDRNAFDLPSFLVDAIRSIVGTEGTLTNATALFIGEDGVRVTNNANEIAHYEFGAALASDCILDAMDQLEPGISEFALGSTLNRLGQHNSVVTIAASGERFIKGNMFPTERVVKVGDPVSLTVGYRGGSSSRNGLAVRDASELPEGQKDYLEKIATPYFITYAAWLEQIHIGMCGGDLFALVEKLLPRDRYGWKLCPGHLTAEEEWMASPIYEGSTEVLRSGMLLQIDIIPSVPGYTGVCAESTVALADAALQQELEAQYPALWERMQRRRSYLEEQLGIKPSADILPMCSTVGYLRPYLLDKTRALTLRHTKK